MVEVDTNDGVECNSFPVKGGSDECPGNVMGVYRG